MGPTYRKSALGAYLRLNNASLDEWLAALRELSGCDDIHCRLHSGSGRVGALSVLESELGHVISLRAGKSMDVSGCRASDPVLLFPGAGMPEINIRGGGWGTLDQLFLARPEDRFELRLPPKTEVIILKPGNGALDDSRPRSSGAWLSVLQVMIGCYLDRLPFVRDDDQAKGLTNRLFDSMKTPWTPGKAAVCSERTLDRRLQRVVEKIMQDPVWEFDLKELANFAGVSERNLYYLMNRETGITPYRFYQRARLTRVRERLVDCQCEVPHISWYAADEGFSHLGRFAAIYREHFGELPSETVQWRRNLLRHSDASRAELVAT
ncbi:helix-turn-helix domain-containing protein [Marinobacter adhaerens]|uniref:helix-turn-helix domain-containing protein n=1 Tax=Marinobacter adhaerens TaxID=1033846 RepID=UPI001E322B7E|nr:helix-turn-helix domain-containing protein [Marinobacter adhaerens]MCD1645902.1 helix-turn-helix domain-containing protein [Marinobacter adhaerens]